MIETESLINFQICDTLGFNFRYQPAMYRIDFTEDPGLAVLAFYDINLIDKIEFLINQFVRQNQMAIIYILEIRLRIPK